MEAFFIDSYAKGADCRADHRPEFAFIGRSNVGKSSLINMIFGRTALAKISSKPGKTRLLNLFASSEEWLLMDMPGYGWAKCSKAEKARICNMNEAYLLSRSNLACLLILLDVRLLPQPIDIDFIRWAATAQLPLALIFTKADKCSGSVVKRNVDVYEKQLLKDWAELPPRFLSSSRTQKGRKELLDFFAETKQVFEKQVADS